MENKTINNINFADELKSGKHYGVFIDDTGSPGLDIPGLHMHRKSWVAVLIPPNQMPEVVEQLPRALSYLKEMGINDPEFHFHEILSGKGDYKKIELKIRLAIFKFMTHIFQEYKFTVLAQTFDPDNSAKLLTKADFPESFGPLKFKRHDDLALIILIMRVRQYLTEQKVHSQTACVVVDEGRLKDGKAIIMPGLAPEFIHGAILFSSSRRVRQVQLADFAAFVLNKWQLLRVKPELTEMDKALLEIFSPLRELFINTDEVKLHGFPNFKSIRDAMH